MSSTAELIGSLSIADRALPLGNHDLIILLRGLIAFEKRQVIMADEAEAFGDEGLAEQRRNRRDAALAIIEFLADAGVLLPKRYGASRHAASDRSHDDFPSARIEPSRPGPLFTLSTASLRVVLFALIGYERSQARHAAFSTAKGEPGNARRHVTRRREAVDLITTLQSLGLPMPKGYAVPTSVDMREPRVAVAVDDAREPWEVFADAKRAKEGQP